MNIAATAKAVALVVAVIFYQMLVLYPGQCSILAFSFLAGLICTCVYKDNSLCIMNHSYNLFSSSLKR